MKYYFLRVNGKTQHDNPKDKKCYVAAETSDLKRNGYSNYLNYCFEHDIVRIGWPDVGDLSSGDRAGARSDCYSLSTIPSHIRTYLLTYRDIQPGSVLLVPDRDHSGSIYICEIVKPYWYDPSDPYECAHRLKVNWDRDHLLRPIKYTNNQFGIAIGGWWLRAFHEINNQEIITKIETERKRNH